MNLVVDASLMVRVLLNDDVSELLRKRLMPPRILNAPHLIDAEVASAIRGLTLGGKVTERRSDEMRADYMDLRIVRHTMAPMLPRVLDLRKNLTAYDAFYVVLAEALQCSFYTSDAKFTGAVGHHADINVV